MKRRQFLRLLAAGAVAGVAPAGGSTASKPDRSFVRGRVTSAGKPLAGVAVSNGRHQTQTDAAGGYRLPATGDLGRFVFVSCPRGHWTDRFYCPIDQALSQGQADFALEPLAQADRFDFVFAADLSDLDNAAHEVGRQKTKASFAEICDRKPRPAFLLVQGDLGIGADGGAGFLDCLKSVTIPVRLGIGNHEIQPAAANPKGVYERLFGPTYYSFDWGPVHFVILDGNKPAASPGHSLGMVEPRELAWLEADLAAQPAGKPIIVAVHIPIVSTYPARRPDLEETKAPFWQSANRDHLTSLFTRHGVRLVLQGHFHENERIIEGGVEYVESVSLCGRWWKSGAGQLERATDGTPRGYRVVSIDGDSIRHRYESSCESRVTRQGEFLGLRDSIAPDRKTALAFTCYDAPNGSTARARLDDAPWREVPQVVLPGGAKKPHHWTWTEDTTALPPGRHTVEIEVTWPDGTVVRETDSFDLRRRGRDGPAMGGRS